MLISDLIGSSPKFRVVLEAVETVAPADCAVLIRRETGTGKELIARAIHDASPRRQHQFVTINCAAIPAALLESELFGHERGAFTGAVTSRMGRFQAADRGTLFLDAIGELPRLNFSLSFCVCFKSGNSNDSGVRKPLESMCGSWRQRIRISGRWLSNTGFALISITD